jgi:O-antigen/teichoic acid export membrane protein
MGVGKHKPLAPLMVAEGLCNLGLSILLVRRMGIVGVAWGTAIPNVMAAVMFWPWYACRTLEVAPARFVSAVWIRPAIAISPFAIVTYFVERHWPAATLYGFMFQVALCVPVAMAGFWLLCLSEAHRQLATGFVRSRWRTPVIEPVAP